MAPNRGGRPILLLGGSGQIGWELKRALAPLGAVLAPVRAELDLACPASIRHCLDRLTPSLIVNAAAYTNVDQAERDPATAMAVNGVAPGILGDVAKRHGIPLIHYSTDYVFSGKGARTKDGALRPYRETDPVGPLNAYGRSKQTGESAIRASGCDHLIFRTSWIYANRGRNFLMTMRRLAFERDELAVVDDQLGCPTWARLVAQATAQSLSRRWTLDTARLPEAVCGTYHLTCSGAVSWFGFAEEIFSILLRRGVRVPRLRPVPTASYATAARRPAYSVLDCTKARTNLGVLLPDWRAALAMCLSDETSGNMP